MRLADVIDISTVWPKQAIEFQNTLDKLHKKLSAGSSKKASEDGDVLKQKGVPVWDNAHVAKGADGKHTFHGKSADEWLKHSGKLLGNDKTAAYNHYRQLHVMNTAPQQMAAGGPGSGPHSGGLGGVQKWGGGRYAEKGQYERGRESSAALGKHGWKDVGNGIAFKHASLPGHNIQLNRAGGFEHFGRMTRQGNMPRLKKGTSTDLPGYLATIHGNKVSAGGPGSGRHPNGGPQAKAESTLRRHGYEAVPGLNKHLGNVQKAFGTKSAGGDSYFRHPAGHFATVNRGGWTTHDPSPKAREVGHSLAIKDHLKLGGHLKQVHSTDIAASKCASKKASKKN